MIKTLLIAISILLVSTSALAIDPLHWSLAYTTTASLEGLRGQPKKVQLGSKSTGLNGELIIGLLEDSIFSAVGLRVAHSFNNVMQQQVKLKGTDVLQIIEGQSANPINPVLIVDIVKKEQTKPVLLLERSYRADALNIEDFPAKVAFIAYDKKSIKIDYWT